MLKEGELVPENDGGVVDNSTEESPKMMFDGAQSQNSVESCKDDADSRTISTPRDRTPPGLPLLTTPEGVTLASGDT